MRKKLFRFRSFDKSLSRLFGGMIPRNTTLGKKFELVSQTACVQTLSFWEKNICNDFSFIFAVRIHLCVKVKNIFRYKFLVFAPTVLFWIIGKFVSMRIFIFLPRRDKRKTILMNRRGFSLFNICFWAN